MTNTVSYRQKFLLGVDYGSKFVGLSSYGPGDPCPTPYGRIANKSEAFVIQELKKTIKMEGAEVLVIGVPKLTDGKETGQTQKIRDFITKVKTQIDEVEIIEQDETLSTFEAKERMKRSPLFNYEIDYQKIDALAATIILEDFLAAKDRV